MVRNLEGEKLDGWLEEAEACRTPAMRRFALGLRKDLPAGAKSFGCVVRYGVENRRGFVTASSFAASRESETS